MADSLNTKILNTKKDISDIILKHIHTKKSFTALTIKSDYQAGDLTNIFDFADWYCNAMVNKRDEETIENLKKTHAQVGAVPRFPKAQFPGH